MINLTPVWTTLLLELIAGFTLLFIAFFIIKARRKAKEHQAAEKFINDLNRNLSTSNHELAETITNDQDASNENITTFLSEIKEKEKVLYQKIIQLFLSKDPNVLGQIDQGVHGLSSAFCNLISHTARNINNQQEPTASDNLDWQEKLSQLEQENKNLKEELTRTTSMLDNLSADYTLNYREKKSADSKAPLIKTQKVETTMASTNIKKPASTASFLEEL